jgi:molybdopterin-guanine dinucleotide biosynthesis protein A
MSSTDKHQDRIVKPDLGSFGRNELAVYGTTCENIKIFVTSIQQALRQFDIAYIDADHHHSSVTNTTFQEKDQSFGISLPNASNPFSRRSMLSGSDALLINGNHFPGKAQLIFCDTTKEQSLLRRAEQLNNIVAIVKFKSEDTIPEYILQLMPGDKHIPAFSLESLDEFVQWYMQHFLAPPAIQVLILGGGKSIRMGADKTMIVHHDKPQVRHLADLADRLNLPVYVSCRQDQQDQFASMGLRTIADRIHELGPAGGIISAFMKFPDCAWLTLAADIPMIDEAVLTTLIKERNYSKIATAYQSVTDGLPEPLITIWEPKSYPIILSFLAQGYSCPRKVLINSETQLISSPQAEKLINVNTPEELSRIREKLQTTNSAQPS